MCMFAEEGNVFVINSVEGIKLKVKIINEEDKSATVLGLDFSSSIEVSEESSLTIPSMANSYHLTSIADNAFTGCDFRAVIIMEGIKKVGKNSFAECNNLQEISLPSTIQSFGSGCFVSKNIKLVKVYFDNPVEAFGNIFDEWLSLDSNDSGSWEYGIYNNAILYVPKGSLYLFRSTIPWAYFNNICEFDTETTAIDTQFVYNYNSWNAHSTAIFDLTGRRFNSIPEKGMYIQGGKKYFIHK